MVVPVKAQMATHSTGRLRRSLPRDLRLEERPEIATEEEIPAKTGRKNGKCLSNDKITGRKRPNRVKRTGAQKE